MGASANVFDLARGRDGQSSASEQDSKLANSYQFRLSEERYLEGMDTRCIIQYDEEKFAAVVWGQSEIFIIDREKPDAVNSFETLANPCKQNLCMQLLPFFDPVTFPFAFVLSQTQLMLADLRRMQAFVIAPWKFKGAPHNNHQMEIYLS